MRILAIIIVLASFPAFMALLRSPRYRRWAFVSLGALPILYVPLNLDGSFIAWPHWLGHTRGLTLIILDPLALAICLRYGKGRLSPPFLWAFGLYLFCLVPSLSMNGYFTPAFFFVFQTMRITLFFYAVYLATLGGQMMRIVEGLAIAVIASGLWSGYEALSGAVQARGLLGHQNLTGFATNLCIPLLLALGLRMKRYLFLLAVACGALGAIAGGSRATMVFFALATTGTMFATFAIRPTGRMWVSMGLVCLALVAASPFAIQKLNERNVSGFQLDDERLAFERAAKFMIEDYPLGAGINQYVSVANAEGYFDQAGVRWGVGARSTNVHNAYLLYWAEAGLLGLMGFAIWLLAPLITSISLAWRKGVLPREVSVGCGIALLAAMGHSRYEWVLLTATPQYLVSLMMAIIAALAVYDRKTRQREDARSAKHWVKGAIPPVLAPAENKNERPLY